MARNNRPRMGRTELRLRSCTAVYAFEVGGVLVKEPSVLAFAVRNPLVMGKQPLLRPPLNLLLVFQFDIRFLSLTTVPSEYVFLEIEGRAA